MRCCFSFAEGKGQRVGSAGTVVLADGLQCWHYSKSLQANSADPGEGDVWGWSYNSYEKVQLRTVITCT